MITTRSNQPRECPRKGTSAEPPPPSTTTGRIVTLADSENGACAKCLSISWALDKAPNNPSFFDRLRNEDTSRFAEVSWPNPIGVAIAFKRPRIAPLKFLEADVMASYEIEIILNRQLADCLSLPVFITDTAGDLIFYNEAAEKILGRRFEETGEMTKEKWSTVFKPLDDQGKPLPPEELPLVRTLKDVYPYHKSMRIEGLNGAVHDISVTSYPIISRSGNFLGAVAIFWKRR
jgi:PAS domain-containing protein